MKLVPCIKCICLVSILSLVYIHLQMQIFDLAYQGKKKEKIIKNISEENGHINYQISCLKSAHHLGSKVLANNSEMQFADKESVVQLVTSERINDSLDVFNESLVKKKKNPLLSLLSIDLQKEARAQE